MRGLLIATLLLGACSSDSSKSYETYQACFDDVIKSKPMKTETIVECCLERDIGGGKPPHCGDAEPDCINYLTTNLKQTDADITVQQEACAAYVAEKAMQ